MLRFSLLALARSQTKQVESGSLLQISSLQETLDAAYLEIWDGMDASLPTPASDKTTALRLVKRLDRDVHKIHVQLLAPPDTGSNLFKHLVEGAFNGRVREVGVVAKHWQPQHGTFSEFEAEIRDRFTDHGETFSRPMHVVIITRSPVSLLASWEKAPYFLDECVTQADIQQPCNFSSTEEKKMLERYPRMTKEWTSLADVYNTYNAFYAKVQEGWKTLPFIKSVTTVSYEDLVCNSTSVLQHFSEAIDVDLDTAALANLQDGPAKHHGDAVGHAAAIAKITKLSHLSEVAPDKKDAFCAGIDPRWLEVSTAQCPGGAYPYHKDCDTA